MARTTTQEFELAAVSYTSQYSGDSLNFEGSSLAAKEIARNLNPETGDFVIGEGKSIMSGTACRFHYTSTDSNRDKREFSLQEFVNELDRNIRITERTTLSYEPSP